MLCGGCGGGGDAPSEPAPVAVATVEVSPATSTLEVGQTGTYSAVSRAADGGTLTGRTATWTTSNAVVATVSNGLVSAVAPGTASISALVEGRTGTATVTVVPVPVARVVLSTHAASVVVGASTTLTAQTQSAAGATLTGRALAWQSTAPSVATVADGAISAVSVGTTLIIASSEGRADTATVTVTPVPVATVLVSPTTAALFVGGTTTLTATARDGGGATLTGRSVTWSSSSAAVASVAAGVVTGIAPGTATITVSVEGKTATASVTVSLVPVATVVVSPTTVAVDVGSTATLSATTRDAGGGTLTGRSIAWSSSDATRATVVDGVITGVSPGTATITATSEGKSGSAQVTIATPAATWTPTTELQIGTIDTLIRFNNVAIAADGRAVYAAGTRVYERAADGTWNTTGTVINGTPAVIRVAVDPGGTFWASGSNGVIVRRTAGGWIPENTGTDAQAFQAIDFAADGTGIGVGNSPSVIYRRSASGVWSTQNITNSTILTEVGLGGPNFAVTIGSSGSGGVGFQWNGSTWSAITFPVPNFRPSNLLVVSATEAYITGVSGTDPLSNQRYMILQWNGSSWSVYFQRPIEVYPNASGLVRCGDGTIYFGSYWGTIYRKQGASFGPLPGDRAYSTSVSLFCESDNSLWLSMTGSERRLMRYNNGTWQLKRFVPDPTGLAMDAAGRVFITTPFGVTRGTGSSLEYTTIPLANGSPVFIPPRVFASGTNAVVGGAPPGSFNGTAWLWGPASPSRGYAGIWGPSANQVFAVGGFNVIDVFNGSTWSTVAIPGGGPTTLATIRGSGNYAVASPNGSGSAVQWSGGGWSLFPSAPPFGWSLYEVFSPNDIVVLANNTLSRWNGTTWSNLPGGSISGSPVAMLARSATDIYIFRTSDILHYDGASTRIIGQTGGNVRAVTANGSQAIAVGTGGLVLRATLPSASTSTNARR